MEKVSLEAAIEEIIKSFEMPDGTPEDRTKESGITFWLPVDYKIKFEMLQCRSRRRFSKLARVALMQIIDKASEKSA